MMSRSVAGLPSANQRTAFLAGEGDGWFERNRAALAADGGASDPVIRALADLPLPRRILEIGCADGWRLERLRQASGAACFGVEPSATAIAEGTAKHPELALTRGTADRLPFADSEFDVVIFGFCLYLCDPADHFRIAAEADRVLADGGWMVIYDFLPPGSWRNPYAHRDGLYSHKMDYARMFTWHPSYRVHEVSRAESGAQPAGPDDRIAVTVLHKRQREAFPDNPYRRT